MTAVEAIRKTGAKVDTITLSPLNIPHINEMLVDTLRCSGDTAMPLAELVERKTGGNPFFVTRFLNTLYEEGLLAFNFDGRRWQWDLDTIHNVGITDNVVDLMVRKIRKYPDTTQHALRLAACIGNQFDLRTLSTIHEKSGEETSGDLWDAVKDGLVIGVGWALPTEKQPTPTNGVFGGQCPPYIIGDQENPNTSHNPRFRFLHDRVQQAAYSLITDDLKKGAHLTIGRRLLKNNSEVETEENLFDIVNHLNTGIGLITSQEERNGLARLKPQGGQEGEGVNGLRGRPAAYNDRH